MDGEKHGLATMWHENGQKRMECTFVEGESHGLGTEWDEDGNVISQTNFENGKEVEEVKYLGSPEMLEARTMTPEP